MNNEDAQLVKFTLNFFSSISIVKVDGHRSDELRKSKIVTEVNGGHSYDLCVRTHENLWSHRRC